MRFVELLFCLFRFGDVTSNVDAAKQLALDFLASKRGTPSELKALDLVACYDAAGKRVRSTGGRIVKIKRSHAQEVLTGSPSGLFVHRPGTAFGPGTYLVAFRFMALERVSPTICTLDVRAGGKSIRNYAPPSTKYEPHVWSSIAYDIRLTERTELEFRVWGRGGTILQSAIDLLENARDFPKEAPILVITDGMIDILTIGREHAFLLPGEGELPFEPQGPVFRILGENRGGRVGGRLRGRNNNNKENNNDGKRFSGFRPRDNGDDKPWPTAEIACG